MIALISGGGSALLVSQADGLTGRQAGFDCQPTGLRRNNQRDELSAQTLQRGEGGTTGPDRGTGHPHHPCPQRRDREPAGRDRQRADCAGFLHLGGCLGAGGKVRSGGETPAAVVARLQAGLRGEIPDTPDGDVPVFAASQTVVVADNFLAAQAPRRKAEALGYNSLLLSTFLDGDTANTGRLLAALAKEVQASGNPLPAPACLILGGETTVQLGENPGKGGRNRHWPSRPGWLCRAARGSRLFPLPPMAATAPQTAPGAMADGGTVARGRRSGSLRGGSSASPRCLPLSGRQPRSAAYRPHPDQCERSDVCLC